MNDDLAQFTRDQRLVSRCIGGPLAWLIGVSSLLYGGSTALGLPDVGISTRHLLAISVSGILTLWLGGLWVESRARKRKVDRWSKKRLTKGLLDSGLTPDEVAERMLAGSEASDGAGVPRRGAGRRGAQRQ